MSSLKADIVRELKKNILKMQGFKTVQPEGISFEGLEHIEAAFPNAIFPTGTMHEFLSTEPEFAAATGGFIAGLLQTLMIKGRGCIWVSRNRCIFPPALKTFGIEPDRIIFVHVKHERDALWVMEEALKCEGLAAVIGEVNKMDFSQSRRMQLVTEKSGITGFVLLRGPKKQGSTACSARWLISPAKSELDEKLPGVGFPRWNVELIKVRNGNPGSWQVEWTGRHFINPVAEHISKELPELHLQTG